MECPMKNFVRMAFAILLISPAYSLYQAHAENSTAMSSNSSTADTTASPSPSPSASASIKPVSVSSTDTSSAAGMVPAASATNASADLRPAAVSTSTAVSPTDTSSAPTGMTPAAPAVQSMAPPAPGVPAVPMPAQPAATATAEKIAETTATENLEFISGEITGADQAAKTITVKLYGETENAAADKILTVKVDESTDITDGEKDRDFKSLTASTEVDVEYDPATNKATYIFVY